MRGCDGGSIVWRSTKGNDKMENSGEINNMNRKINFFTLTDRELRRRLRRHRGDGDDNCVGEGMTVMVGQILGIDGRKWQNEEIFLTEMRAVIILIFNF